VFLNEENQKLIKQIKISKAETNTNIIDILSPPKIRDTLKVSLVIKGSLIKKK